MQDEDGEMDADDDGMAGSRMLVGDDDSGVEDPSDEDDEESLPEITAGSAEETEFVESTMVVWKVSTNLHCSEFDSPELFSFRYPNLPTRYVTRHVRELRFELYVWKKHFNPSQCAARRQDMVELHREHVTGR